MSKPRRASYAVTSAELPVLKTLGLEEVDPEEVFELQRKEGAGAFGRVFRACYKQNRSRLAALKVIPVALEAGERGEDIESVRREIQFLRECDHPNVVAFHGAYYKDGALWVAMEHCAGGSVGDVRRVRSLSEREISVIMRGALRGLAYLHSRRKIHRDVKGGNILLTDSGQVKIADFGVSAQLRDTLSRRGSFVGTPYWMSPELIQDSDYDFKADIWSLGITAIELADQKPPLFDEHPMRVLIQIPRNPPPQVAHPENWSAAFLDFLRFCLRKDPAERPTALECMEHEFIRREAHIERVFASGEVVKGLENGVKAANEVHNNNRGEISRATSALGSASDKADAVSVPVVAAPSTISIEQELDEEIAEEIGGDDHALSEASASSDECEASTGLLGETFEFRESAVQSSATGTLSAPSSTSVSTPKLSDSADDLLNLSADESFALEKNLPALSQVESKVQNAGKEVLAQATDQQLQAASNTTSFRQPATELKLLPSSAKSPVIHGSASRDSSIRFVKPPRPNSPAAALRPKTCLSPPPSPSMQSSWLSVSSSQNDPLASIDTVTNARVNRLLSSFSTSTSSPSLVAAMRAYNDQYAVDAPTRSATRQSFNWRSVEAALPSASPPLHGSVPGNTTSGRSSGKIFVGDPFRASHDVCVKYNSIQAQYEGAPMSAEWAALHQQFGIALSHMRCRSSAPQSAGLEDQVPALLRMLRRELVRHGGLRCKYIYRVSPAQEEVQRAKAAINRGSFEPAQVVDPHVHGSLVKIWLRELPSLLLDVLDVQDLAAVTKLAKTQSSDEDDDGLHLVTPGNIDLVDAQITRTLQKLGARENAVFQWLLEHMLEVNAHRTLNQMTTHALATVMAPNLFSCSGMARASQENAGNLMRQVVTFIRVLLSWRRASLGSSPTFLLELEEKNVAAAFSTSAETSAAKGKVSVLQERVRQSLTKLVKSTESSPEAEGEVLENASLVTVLLRRIDRLWSDLEKSEVTTVETTRQEHALRRVFVDFQHSMLLLVVRYSKRTDDRIWANDVIIKLKASQQLETNIPESLSRMNEWMDAALSFDAFCRLLDREQTTRDKMEKLQTRYGGKTTRCDNNLENQCEASASDLSFTTSVFSHLTRVHQRQNETESTPTDEKAFNSQSNQREDSNAARTDQLLVDGAVQLASRGQCINDARVSSRLLRNVAKLGEHQPAIGNLLTLLGDRKQNRPQTGAQSLGWLQEQILESIPTSSAL